MSIRGDSEELMPLYDAGTNKANWREQGDNSRQEKIDAPHQHQVQGAKESDPEAEGANTVQPEYAVDDEEWMKED